MKYKYKVCVYAICKNEEKHISRWYESVKEADEIYVLDTGSSDDSVAKLKSYGVNVVCEKIEPWRFDVARNRSLELVPEDTDICVCVDLDEIYEPGWRKKMEASWEEEGTTRIRYIYNWKIENDKPIVSFYYEKVHARFGYKWTHPVHEVLTYLGDQEKKVTNDEIILNHYPDSTKSRSSYLPLLELSVKEDPEDDRNMHYLGREYMYYGRYNEAIDVLIKHLGLKKATWKDERAASMRFIGRSYLNLGRIEEARLWYLKSIKEAPHLRDGLVELSMLEYNQGNYLDVITYLTKALTIKDHERTYINEIFSWDYTIDNLLSVSYYYLGLFEISLFYIERALEKDSGNELLIKNHELILNEIEKKPN